ncbi:TLD-domain-containing protein [Nemania sp. NC0429]|nr:TLD-domain-containing protein [Nemania sp. NC0429]
MPRHDTGNLIDFDDSPTASGTTTPSHQLSPPPNPRRPRQSSPSPPGPRPPPLPHAATSTTTSSSGYGIGSAVWGLLRRISTADSSYAYTDASTLPPSGMSQQRRRDQSAAGTGRIPEGDGIHGAFTPPRRTATPRGLPSLDPVSLRGYRDDTDPDERLLARGIAEEIRTFLPERLKIMDEWRLVYSLYQNGSSLATLYQLCEKYRGVRAGFVLVVRDAKDGIFGAYLTEAPHPASSYYGTGECFLWRASLHAALPPPPSADTTDLNYRVTTISSSSHHHTAAQHTSTSMSTSTSTNGTSSSSHPHPQNLSLDPLDPITNNRRAPSPMPSGQSVRFQAFAYTGANDYCMFCETKFLSVGGGHGGTFGLWLNDGLSRGHSAECDTFLNQPLSDEGEKFDVFGVELWVVGAS